MKYRIVKTLEDFELLKDDWERIEKLSPITTYLSTFHYNFVWWKICEKAEQNQLFIIVIYNNNRVVGIAPLKIEKAKSRLYSYFELKFLAPGDYSDFLVDIGSGVDSMKIIAEVFTAIKEHQKEYDKIWLTHISQHTLLVHFLLTSKNNRDLHYLIENPYIDFSKYESFEKYTNSFLPKKIKQYVNRLQREVDYKMIVTDENIVNKISKIHIDEKNYLHTKAKIQRHSLFEDKTTYSFLNSLYSNNENVLTYLLVDNNSNEEIICYYSGYVYNNVFHSGITAYNPKYQRFAVGKIFNYLIFDNNMKEKRWTIFDMGTGRYAWKFEMTDTFNLLYQFRVFQPSDKKISYLEKCEKLISDISQILRK